MISIANPHPPNANVPAASDILPAKEFPIAFIRNDSSGVGETARGFPAVPAQGRIESLEGIHNVNENRVGEHSLRGPVSNAGRARAILDLSEATLHAGPAVMSANPIETAALDGKKYFLKGGQPMLDGREAFGLVMTRILADAPKAYIATLPNGTTKLATEAMDYKDFIEAFEDPEIGRKIAEQFQDQLDDPCGLLARFKNHAAELRWCQERIKPMLSRVGADNKAPWWAAKGASPDPALVQEYRPLHERLDKIMQRQFDLMPQGIKEQIADQMLVAELLGEWDRLNPLYRNMGICTLPNGAIGVSSVDTGAAFDVGFRGGSKAAGYETAVNQRPAVFAEEEPFHKANARFDTHLTDNPYERFPYPTPLRNAIGSIPLEPARSRLAYKARCLLEKGVLDSLASTFIDDADRAHEFMSRNEILETVKGRIAEAVRLAGGKAALQAWEMRNPDQAGAFRREIDEKLSRL